MKKRVYIVLLLLSSISYSGTAATYNSDGDGAWETAANWTSDNMAGSISGGNLTLGNGDIVVINNDITLSLNLVIEMNNVSITVKSGHTLTLTNIEAKNNLDFIVETGAILIVNGDFTVNNGADITISGNATINGDVSVSQNNDFVVSGNLTVDGNFIGTINGNTISGSGNVTITGIVSGVDTSGISGTLPISLVLFSVQNVSPGNFEFKWITASETDNAFFNIEYSTDAENWQDIYQVAGAGTSTTTRDYKARAALDGEASIVYFRLKQTDIDGKYTYSDVASVSTEESTHEDARLSLSIYPMPATIDELKMSARTRGCHIINIQIVNAAGRILYHGAIDMPSTYEFYLADYCSLTPGLYRIQLSCETTCITETFVVKK